MAKHKQDNKASLETRFEFAEDSFARIEGQWDSHLRLATGCADGEQYLVRLFKKTGTALDDDLKAIIARGLRRIRRVLSSRRAREVLVEVLEIAEDAQEIAIHGRSGKPGFW
jgi:DNA polymerase alpha-associated DNA helicase A